uniref:Uncharacterized protein n=1 Tax=uncultured bacterium esnapd1.2 TaxID=1366589 RepID=S5UAG2_9BACT|nr:hypothetical protein [uncultured bacterium esnapd1.2]
MLEENAMDTLLLTRQHVAKLVEMESGTNSWIC